MGEGGFISERKEEGKKKGKIRSFNDEDKNLRAINICTYQFLVHYWQIVWPKLN